MTARRAGRRLLAVALLPLALLGFVAVRRVRELAADPPGEKDCPPPAPWPADTGKPTRLVVAPARPLAWAQQGGAVNDASCLNRTPVHGVVEVRDVEDVRAALALARDNGLKVSIAGARHSMGGHAFARGALVLDMRRLARMSLDAPARVLSVQAGATWHDVQTFLHPRFAVKAMQSTDIFTVGGSIAVNAHGMDHRAGSVGRTVRAMRVMLADGSIRRVSRAENPELFRLVVGGYGLVGVVVDAELDVTDNVLYRSQRRVIGHREFPALFDGELARDERVGLMYGHLSTSPGSYLDEMLLYLYREAAGAGDDVPPLDEVGAIRLRRFVFNLAKRGTVPMRIKWLAEKHLEPWLESCPVRRAQAQGQGEACLVPRNQPMHDSVRYLKNALPGETDILHEYFVPHAAFVPFVDAMRAALRQADANLLNASVRVVHREDHALAYAPADMFAIVLYLNQRTDAEGDARMRALTRRLIDIAADHGGTFFLPYQLHYTNAQLHRAYPDAARFFAAKRRWDPGELLTSTFYEAYGRL